VSKANSGGIEKIPGRTIHPGSAEGEALVSRMGISFFGGVDPDTGIVVEKGHDLEGTSVAGKVLVFPGGKGSTVGSFTLYRMQKAGTAPAAVLNAECEPITAVGCILAGIPCLDRLPIGRLSSGERLRVDGAQGCVERLPSPSSRRRPSSGSGGGRRTRIRKRAE
jgi:predicted aconitase with swiveling domain